MAERGDWRSRVHQLREVVEDRTGLSVQTRERVEFLEEALRDRRTLAEQLRTLAYTALNYRSERHDIRGEERRELVERARIVWRKDAMAGAAIDLRNEFVFGSGMHKPKAVDELVQEVIDEFWTDPDNEEILTTLDAQLALGVDLELQCNIFMLVFDQGDDGKVKLGILEHDSVERPIRDENFRQRILYYLAYELEGEYGWDFTRDEPAITPNAKKRPRYYEHWRNVDIANDQAEKNGDPPPKAPPDEKMGDGKVFHLRLNRGTEMAFGHPRLDRLIRWYSAYNRFLEDRLDVMHAKAAFIMQRQVKGSPSQLDKIASRSLSVLGELGSNAQHQKLGPEGAANILNSNEAVDYKEMSLDTGASSAEADGRMIRSPISAANQFPPTYFGDMSSGTLATATSLELPVLKGVEMIQEFWERLVRFSVDRAVERAVETGRIPKKLTAAEVAKRRQEAGGPAKPPSQDAAAAAGAPAGTPAGPVGVPAQLAASYQEQGGDEEDTQRDLTYQFKMPNPLKRMLGDLMTAIQTIATVFDPNNTNMELSRVLLAVALSEGLELDSVPEMVERILPPGYEDPAVAAAAAAGQPSPSGFGEFTPGTPDGQQHPADNPYGAPLRSPQPGQPGALQHGLAEARPVVTLGRGGQQIVWERQAAWANRVLTAAGVTLDQKGVRVGDELVESRTWEDLPEDVRRRHAQRLAEVERELEDDVAAAFAPANGNHKRG